MTEEEDTDHVHPCPPPTRYILALSVRSLEKVRQTPRNFQNDLIRSHVPLGRQRLPCSEVSYLRWDASKWYAHIVLDTPTSGSRKAHDWSSAALIHWILGFLRACTHFHQPRTVPQVTRHLRINSETCMAGAPCTPPPSVQLTAPRSPIFPDFARKTFQQRGRPSLQAWVYSKKSVFVIHAPEAGRDKSPPLIGGRVGLHNILFN